jgi:hypothetical protein
MLVIGVATCTVPGTCDLINGNYSNGTVTGNFAGTIASVDDIANCTNDAIAIYSATYEERTNFTTLVGATTLGSGRTLTPGCYYQVAAINTAASTNITLDAEGDPNAVFVIVSDGALGLGADSYVVLKNCATYENIFWIIQGAISLGAGSILQGTTLVNGAFTLGANAKLCGRALAPVGALTMGLESSIIVGDCDLDSRIAVDIGSCDSFAMLVSGIATCTVPATCELIKGNYSNGTVIGNFSGTIASVDEIANCANDAIHTYWEIFEERKRYTPLVFAGQTLTPGYYYQAAAINTAASTNITLDAEGDPNAVFIIFSDGALGLGAYSYVVLENGATYENILWVIQGAVSLGEGSILQGTTLVYGAFTFGSNAKLCGRALAPVGALTMGLESSIIVDDCDL